MASRRSRLTVHCLEPITNQQSPITAFIAPRPVLVFQTFTVFTAFMPLGTAFSVSLPSRHSSISLRKADAADLRRPPYHSRHVSAGAATHRLLRSCACSCRRSPHLSQGHV